MGKSCRWCESREDRVDGKQARRTRKLDRCIVRIGRIALLHGVGTIERTATHGFDRHALLRGRISPACCIPSPTPGLPSTTPVHTHRWNHPRRPADEPREPPRNGRGEDGRCTCTQRFVHPAALDHWMCAAMHLAWTVHLPGPSGPRPGPVPSPSLGCTTMSQLCCCDAGGWDRGAFSHSTVVKSLRAGWRCCRRARRRSKGLKTQREGARRWNCIDGA